MLCVTNIINVYDYCEVLQSAVLFPKSLECLGIVGYCSDFQDVLSLRTNLNDFSRHATTMGSLKRLALCLL